MPDNAPNAPASARPVVNIFLADSKAADLAQVLCLGLEEEGIPWQCSPVAEKADVTSLAKQAADLSKLNVGLAIAPGAGTIVLHHRDLPVAKPLFTLATGRLDPESLRRLGANAARLVKGNPMILDPPQPDPAAADTGKRSPGPPRAATDEVTPDQVAELAIRVLAALRSRQSNKGASQ